MNLFSENTQTLRKIKIRHERVKVLKLRNARNNCSQALIATE